ncbi:MAG: YolD-like family protein [Clostridia bacterium]|nr:YolD-like family protein [Clostridia bacterium]
MVNSKDFRAKQFLPFDALKGFQEALRKKEIEYIPKKELSEDVKEELGKILSSLDIGENIRVKYYNISKYEYFLGKVKKIDKIKRKIIFQDVSEVKFDNIIEIIRI